MANQITGKIHFIGDTIAIPSKDGSKTFYKRELVINATMYNPYTGEPGTPNFPLIEFGGDKCNELDNLVPEQLVTVSYYLQGTKYMDKDGIERYFTKVRGYKVELSQRDIQSHIPSIQPQSNTNQARENDDLPF